MRVPRGQPGDQERPRVPQMQAAGRRGGQAVRRPENRAWRGRASFLPHLADQRGSAGLPIARSGLIEQRASGLINYSSDRSNWRRDRETRLRSFRPTGAFHRGSRAETNGQGRDRPDPPTSRLSLTWAKSIAPGRARHGDERPDVLERPGEGQGDHPELKRLNAVLKPFEDWSARRTTSRPRSSWPRRPRPTNSTRRSARPASRPRPISTRSSSGRCSAVRTTTATRS